MLKRYYIGEFDQYTLPQGDLSLAGHGTKNWFLWAMLMLFVIFSLHYLVMNHTY
jgi:hypothetical protein